jgi:hypothetical protein
MRWGYVPAIAVLVVPIAGCSDDSDQALEDQLAEVTAERDELAGQLAAAEAEVSGETHDEMSTPAEAAIAYGTGPAEAVLVGARIDFAVPDQGIRTTDPDGTQHSRNGRGTATYVGNDPRITGTETFTWNSDRWGSGMHDGAITQWGTTVLETADGTWEGAFSGVFTTATTDVMTYWLTGTGDYAGLSMFMWTTETNQQGEGDVYALIFPGEPPVGLVLEP